MVDTLLDEEVHELVAPKMTRGAAQLRRAAAAEARRTVLAAVKARRMATVAAAAAAAAAGLLSAPRSADPCGPSGVVDRPLATPLSWQPLQSLLEEPENWAKPSTRVKAQQAGSCAAGLAEQSLPPGPPQEALTQRFCDKDVEERFRLYQARMLQPVRAR